jgi:hypothetical protein
MNILDAMQDLKAWTLSKKQQQIANKRSNDLGGESNWIPRDMNLLTKTYKLKAVDFVRISKGAMSYVFAGAFDKPEEADQKRAFDSFNETLRLCLTTHYNADGRPLRANVKEQVATMHQQVSETLSLLEMCAPLIIFDRMLHVLLHMPTAMAKWNACRTFWCFPSERYVTRVLSLISSGCFLRAYNA